MSIFLVCPACNHPLDLSASSDIKCRGCGRQYSRTLGIPDLRVPHSITTSPAEDQLIADLLACYDHTDFAGLLDLRLRNAPLTDENILHIKDYQLAHEQRGRLMVNMFLERAAKFFPSSGTAAALDIGCGTGASLLALSRSYEFVVGIDPSLPALILARKALETAGVTNFHLVQSFGQRIPCQDGVFDYVNALNVLEHVLDLEPVLSEVNRLLAVGGIFAADSRNRYDIFLPEPHARIRLVGFIPRRWQAPYVKWRSGNAYVSTRLLSYRELKVALRRFFQKNYRIVFPYAGAYGRSARFDRWLSFLEKIPILSWMAMVFFPSHLVLAQRSSDVSLDRQP